MTENINMILLYNPNQNRPMYVAGFGSGSCTNLRKILEHEMALKAKDGSPFEMKLIFTDNAGSKAAQVAKEYKIGYMAHDISLFYNLHGFVAKDSKDMTTEQRREIRKAYDAITLTILDVFWRKTGINIDCIALGGYMSYLTEALLDNFLIINVHPADLTKVDEKGQRRYKGDRAVELAIKSGERTISSSMHIARQKVDDGELLMVSAPLWVDIGNNLQDEVINQSALLAEIAGRSQERLKEAGDWVIFPKTIEMTARGEFAFGPDGKIYFRQGNEWKEGPVRLQ